MFLCDAEVGGEYTVSSMWLDKTLARRLETLGMTKGCKLLVMQKKRLGDDGCKSQRNKIRFGRRDYAGY